MLPGPVNSVCYRQKWGIRNVKLGWSRKLLYFGGVLMAAEAHGLPRADKIDRLVRLAAMTPLDRITALGTVAAEAVAAEYDHFLARLSDPDVRRRLQGLTPDQRDEPVFRDLKSRAEAFSAALLALLHTRYPPAHPIHIALVL